MIKDKLISREEHFRKSLFMKVLGGDNPKNRILECIVPIRGSFTIETVEEYTKLSRNKITSLLSELEAKELIKSSSGEYKVNQKNQEIVRLRNLYYTGAIYNVKKAAEALG